MRILLVTNNYTPYSGGVVSSLNALISCLHQQGHSVLLVTLDFLGRKHIDPSWVRRIPSVLRFRYNQNHMAVPWRPAYYLDLWMQEFMPDVVHVHHPFLLGPIAVACAKKRGIRTLFTYHTMYEKYAHYVPAPQALVRPLIENSLRSFCATVDHVIAPSGGIEKQLRSMGMQATSVIPSALRDQFLDEPFAPKELQKPYQLLYVGRLVQEKNVTFLLDLMVTLPGEYQLTLVGYGAFTNYLKNYAYHELKLSQDRVRFVIDPPKHEILNYYRASHLFLFASQTDTQGLVIAESMACSTPVIALDGIGQADCIENGINGFLVTDQHQMRAAIFNLCSDQQLYGRLQQGAYQTAQRYRSADLIAKLVKIYAAN